uniref:Uncharacterized protein n=1 Tax=Rhizophora mucronata TaxID=61149 RepID=A0A2P2PFS6_RHIMU
MSSCVCFHQLTCYSKWGKKQKAINSRTRHC